MQTFDQSIEYSLASGTPLVWPEIPFYSPVTQQIANQFPAWMRLRQDPTSVGQQLLNAFGVLTQEANRAYDDGINSLHLTTADINQADVLYQAQYPLSNPISNDSQPLCIGSGITLTQLGDVDDFLYHTIPTRIDTPVSGNLPSTVVFTDQLLYDQPYTDQFNNQSNLYFQYNPTINQLQKYYIVDTIPDSYPNPSGMYVNPLLYIPIDNILSSYPLVDISGVAVSGQYNGACLNYDTMFILFNNTLYEYDVRSPLIPAITSGWYGNQEQSYLQAINQVVLPEFTVASGLAFDENTDYLWVQSSGYLEYHLLYDYFIFDDVNQIFFFKEKYDDLTINGTSYQQTYFNLWNWFDEFGLLLDTPRLNGEKNQDYKARLLEVFQYRANSATQGYINGTSRELGLDYWGCYPSGEYPTNIWPDGNIPSGVPIYVSGIYPSGVQDTAKINALFDPAFYSTVVDVNNIPSAEFVDYTKEIMQTFPIVWGSGTGDMYGFIWDISPFDGGLNYSTIVPDYFATATSGIAPMWFQSGVRDTATNELTVNFTQNDEDEWIPQVNQGSFFIHDKQYYVYSQPAEEFIPSGTTVYNIQGSGNIIFTEPVVVYDISGAVASGMEYIQVSGFDNLTPYEYILSSGLDQIIFNGPTPDPLDLFYETSNAGYYTIPGWDFNPTHSIVNEGFIWISDQEQTISTSGSYTLSANPTQISFSDPKGSVVIGQLLDIDGTPVAGAQTYFNIATSGVGTLGSSNATSVESTTGLDGRSFTIYHSPTSPVLSSGAYYDTNRIIVSGVDILTTDPNEIWTLYQQVDPNPTQNPAISGLENRLMYMVPNNTYNIQINPGEWTATPTQNPFSAFYAYQYVITMPAAANSTISSTSQELPDDFYNIDLTSLSYRKSAQTTWAPILDYSNTPPSSLVVGVPIIFEADSFASPQMMGKIILHSDIIDITDTYYIRFQTYTPIKPTGIDTSTVPGSTILTYPTTIPSDLNYLIGFPLEAQINSYAVYNNITTNTVSVNITMDYSSAQTGVFGVDSKFFDYLSYLRITGPVNYT